MDRDTWLQLIRAVEGPITYVSNNNNGNNNNNDNINNNDNN